MTVRALTDADDSSRQPLQRRESAGEAKRRREDRALLLRYHRAHDVAAREELVQRFLPLAHHLARRYQRGPEPIDDLIQVASVGLLKAIDRFDPDRQNALSSFVVPTITGELMRHFRDRGWVIRVPRGLQERTSRVERATDALSRELGRRPTPAEVAGRGDVTIEQLLEAREVSATRRPMSLDAALEGASARFERTIAVEEPGYRQAEERATVDKLMRVLDEREREILALRFGDGMLQREIAERIGISQIQVSRLIRRALRRLQEAAEAGERPAPLGLQQPGGGVADMA